MNPINRHVLVLSEKDSLGEITQDMPCYRFHDAQGTIQWPTDFHANLGPVGAWNIFLRLGYSPLWISLKDLFYEEPKGRILVISSLGKWKSPQITAVDIG